MTVHELEAPPPRAVIVQLVFFVTGTFTVTEPLFLAGTCRELFCPVLREILTVRAELPRLVTLIATAQIPFLLAFTEAGALTVIPSLEPLLTLDL